MATGISGCITTAIWLIQIAVHVMIQDMWSDNIVSSTNKWFSAFCVTQYWRVVFLLCESWRKESGFWYPFTFWWAVWCEICRGPETFRVSGRQLNAALMALILDEMLRQIPTPLELWLTPNLKICLRMFPLCNLRGKYHLASTGQTNSKVPN